jgi:hypothetical protein
VQTDNSNTRANSHMRLIKASSKKIQQFDRLIYVRSQISWQ